MQVCEHTISEYTVNGETRYGVTIVYKIGENSPELVAHLTFAPDSNDSSVDSIGTERNGSKAEGNRIWKLMECAGANARRYRVMCEIEGPDNFYRHVDYRR